jgi:predicted MPP superfamily phosphohydrolase
MIVRFIIHHLWLVDLLCLLVAPLLIIVVCRLLGRRHRGRNSVVGIVLALLAAATYGYGRFVGTKQLEVRRVTLTFADLPSAFDGYRLVQFSDLHLGTLPDGMLQRVVDSINAQQPDLILFTGDMVNCESSEMERQLPQLERLKAKDAICSVLGNHDYGFYEYDGAFEADSDEGRLVTMQIDMKWRVFMNGYRYVRRGDQRLVIAGMENDGEDATLRSPQKGDLSAALDGIRRNDFVVLLEHDPTSWRRKILRHCHAQLTLSGHTHGGQLSILGWSPASLRYRECEGLYTLNRRHLYVTKGIGGAIPFRLGATPEIVVITLKKK